MRKAITVLIFFTFGCQAQTEPPKVQAVSNCENVFCQNANNICQQAECLTNTDCDNGIFCDGFEICQQGKCQAGSDPCLANETCHEMTQACVPKAWIPPVGIKRPDFGIDEVAPDYDPNNPLHYYVDNSHPAATNSNNPNGSPDLPRTTIPMGLQAGSNVVVKGGPYNYTSMQAKLYISGNGTLDNPIFIHGPSQDEMPLFTADVFVTGSYILFEHFKFSNHGFELRSVGGPIDHVAVRYCHMIGDQSQLHGGTNDVVGNPTPVHDIVFYNNSIYNNGDDAAETAPDWGRHGFLITYNSTCGTYTH